LQNQKRHLAILTVKTRNYNWKWNWN